jgi:oligopeptide/dipeptide ABC transporter ATP-binding protein
VTRCDALPSSDDATRKLRSGSRDPQLRVAGLSVEFPLEQGPRHAAGQLKAVDRVELRVRRGQTVAVVGEAGAGKTTLARAIARLVPASDGMVLFEGKDLASLETNAQRAALAQILIVTSDMLAGPEPLLALGTPLPKLLIFDEAFAALTEAERLPLFAELRRLQNDQAVACLVLTRSLELASAVSDEILVMHAGQLVETGATASIVSHPQHPYTRDLLAGAAAMPALVSAARGTGCRFRTRCPDAFTRCSKEEPSLFAIPGGLSRCFLHDPDGAGR